MYTGTRLMKRRASEKTGDKSQNMRQVMLKMFQPRHTTINLTQLVQPRHTTINLTQLVQLCHTTINLTQSVQLRHITINLTQSLHCLIIAWILKFLRGCNRKWQPYFYMQLTLDHWPASLKVIVLKSLDEGDRGSIGRGLFQMKG